jgi:2-polyprenyl-6-methoxyphenol hydroxylase-like FAD-dependent oxidoreductase
MAGAPVDVLVVGGGPTGLSLAIELARYGVAVRIVDKTVWRSPYSRAFAVHIR